MTEAYWNSVFLSVFLFPGDVGLLTPEVWGGTDAKGRVSVPPVGISDAAVLVKWAWGACPPPSLTQVLQGDRGTHWLQSLLLVTENHHQSHFQKTITKTHVKELFLYVFFCEFYSSGLIFKSLTHFELIFMSDVS